VYQEGKETSVLQDCGKRKNGEIGKRQKREWIREK
jgi:hypothetical protein